MSLSFAVNMDAEACTLHDQLHRRHSDVGQWRHMRRETHSQALIVALEWFSSLCCCNGWPRHQTAARPAATKGCYQQYHLRIHYSHHTHPPAYPAIRRAEEGDFGRLALKTCYFEPPLFK